VAALNEAAQIALSTAADFLKAYRQPALVRCVLVDGNAVAAFGAAMKTLQLG
jgi:hypothetical protein